MKRSVCLLTLLMGAWCLGHLEADSLSPGPSARDREPAVSPSVWLVNPPATGAVYSASFSPDGKTLLTTSSDATVRIWDARTGQSIQVPFVEKRSFSPRRYQPDNPDNMPMVGPDNFQILQSQIDALEKRVKELEKKLASQK